MLKEFSNGTVVRTAIPSSKACVQIKYQSSAICAGHKLIKDCLHIGKTLIKWSILQHNSPQQQSERGHRELHPSAHCTQYDHFNNPSWTSVSSTRTSWLRISEGICCDPSLWPIDARTCCSLSWMVSLHERFGHQKSSRLAGKAAKYGKPSPAAVPHFLLLKRFRFWSTCTTSD